MSENLFWNGQQTGEVQRSFQLHFRTQTTFDARERFVQIPYADLIEILQGFAMGSDLLERRRKIVRAQTKP